MQAGGTIIPYRAERPGTDHASAKASEPLRQNTPMNYQHAASEACRAITDALNKSGAHQEEQ